MNLFNIAEMLVQATSVWNELKSIHSKEDIHRIFETGQEISLKMKEMFDIGVDVAEDITNVTLIIFGMVERIQDTTSTRTIPKPIQEVTTLDDVLDIVQDKYIEYRINEHYTES